MAHTKVTKNGTQNTGTANTFSYSGSFNVFKASEVEVELDNVDLLLLPVRLMNPPHPENIQ